MISTLFVAWQAPFPPTRGDHFRAAGLIRGLCALGPVTLVTLAPRTDATQPPDGVTHLPLALRARDRLSAATTRPVFPLGVHLYWSPAAARNLASALAGSPFDLCVCFQLRAAFYGRRCPAARRVLELTDSLDLYRKSAAGRAVSGVDRLRRDLLWAGVGRLERGLPDGFDETWLCSAADLQHLADRLGARGSLRLVPQGSFPPVAGDAESLVRERKNSRMARRLLFLGNLDYPPNRDAVRRLAAEIVPSLPEPRPEVWVAGAGWPEGAREYPDLRFLGFVPDLAALVPEVDVSVNPVAFGSGAKSKIPESWRLGLPVVSHAAGAAGFEAGPALRVGGDAGELVRHLRALLDDPAAYATAVADALGRSSSMTWEAIVREAVAGVVGDG